MEKRIARKRKRSKRNRRLLIVLAVILLLTLTTGGLVARYTTQNKREAQMLAADFYISSNYLEGADADGKYKEYHVSDWGDHGIAFELYNYQKENLALIAEEDITYEIEANGCEIEVSNATGIVTPNENGSYTIKKSSTRDVYTVQLSCEDDVNTVEVKVITKSPYQISLGAKFHLIGEKKPDYKITDQGNYVLVTLHSNDYNGAVTVDWTKDFSPDNTNPYMLNWNDEDDPKSLTIEPNSTYELIFFKNNNKTYETQETGVVNLEIGK